MEIFANTYNQLYSLPLIGLRFFTVYGPRGRPDMAPYKFLDSILNDKRFKKYGDGSSLRDYTYIDDIVDGIISALDNKNNLSCEIFNLGNSKPVSLNSFIECCEEVTGKKAKYDIIENQLGDVPLTYADIEKSRKLLNYSPKVSLREGLNRTCKWMIKEGSKYNKNVNDTKNGINKKLIITAHSLNIKIIWIQLVILFGRKILRLIIGMFMATQLEVLEHHFIFLI